MIIILKMVAAIDLRALEPQTLDGLADGEPAAVVEVVESTALGQRLMEMGVTPGTEVVITRRGLFGDPIQLELRGYTLSLRRQQARKIYVRSLQ